MKDTSKKLPVKFPTGVSDLATGLTDMNRDALTLKFKKKIINFFLKFNSKKVSAITGRQSRNLYE